MVTNQILLQLGSIEKELEQLRRDQQAFHERTRKDLDGIRKSIESISVDTEDNSILPSL